MKLDSLDRKLIFLLDRDSRAPLNDLAAELGRSRETVAYRISNLVESGIIKKFVAETDLQKLGLTSYPVYFKLKNVDEKQLAGLLGKLIQQPRFCWTASMVGRFDLVAEIYASDARELDSILAPVLEEHHHSMDRQAILTWVDFRVFGKKYLWPDHPKADSRKPRHHEEYAIDGLDRKILSAISEDARAPVARLAEKIREAPTTVSYRLKQLERLGFIKGYTILCDANALGYTRYKSLLRLRNFSADMQEKLFAFCKTHPNIYFCGKTLGAWDFEIEIEVPNQQEYRKFLITLRTTFDEILTDAETMVIVEEHQFKFWPY